MLHFISLRHTAYIPLKFNCDLLQFKTEGKWIFRGFQIMELRKCLQRRGLPDQSRSVRSIYVGYIVDTELYETYYVLVCVRERINICEN